VTDQAKEPPRLTKQLADAAAAGARIATWASSGCGAPSMVSREVLRLMFGGRQVGWVDPAVVALGREPTDAERGAVAVSGFSWEELAQALVHVSEAFERRAQERRRLWSGPDKMDRQLLRAYRLPWRVLGLVPPSAFSSEYRRRQRARVKRRKR
jgi:hypothetical protein